MKSSGIYAPVMLYGVSLSRLTFLLLLCVFFFLFASSLISFRFSFHYIPFFFFSNLLLFYWAYFEEQSCVEFFFRGFVNVWFLVIRLNQYTTHFMGRVSQHIFFRKRVDESDVNEYNDAVYLSSWQFNVPIRRYVHVARLKRIFLIFFYLANLKLDAAPLNHAFL